MFSWKVGILLLGFLFLAPPLASSKTWIVDDDGGPGVDFTDIQPAIDAAAPGDLIVVRNGDYNGFILFKDLILAADTGRLNREVGWKPALDLETGLDATIEWWRDRLNGNAS